MHGACSACSRHGSLDRAHWHAPVRNLPSSGPRPGHRTLRQESAEVLGRGTILAPGCDGNGHRRLQGRQGAVVTVAGLIPIYWSHGGSQLHGRHQGPVWRRRLARGGQLHPVVLIQDRRCRAGWLLLVFPWPGPAQFRAVAGWGRKRDPGAWGTPPSRPRFDRDRTQPLLTRRRDPGPRVIASNRAVNRPAAVSLPQAAANQDDERGSAAIAGGNEPPSTRSDVGEELPVSGSAVRAIPT